MASRFEISADRQAAENERQESATAKALNDAASYKTEDEKAEARRGALFIQHKLAGTLAMYYYQYPMDPGARCFYAETARYQFPMDRDDQDRER